MLLTVLIFLLLIAGCLTAFACFARSLPEPEQKLIPFAVLPVPDGTPSTRAFLEFYASQIAWMDSEILTTVLLIYPENQNQAESLCIEISRQYDFFTPVSLSQAQKILADRLKKEIF